MFIKELVYEQDNVDDTIEVRWEFDAFFVQGANLYSVQSPLTLKVCLVGF